MELAAYPTDWERLIGTGVASTDMTLIYNAHGTPDNALSSIDHVQSDSVVFIEGFSTGKAETDNGDSSTIDLSYEPYLNTLNNLRLQHGKDHPDYQHFKESVLQSINELAVKYVPVNDSDFTLNSLAEIKGLLKKDCLIFYADYKDFKVEQESNPGEADEYNQRFHKLAHDANMDELATITGSSIGGALHGLLRGARAEILMHDERELFAVHRSLSIMGRLAGLPNDMAELRRSEDGKMAAYTIYGTGHGRSLTQRFAVEGMKPKTIIVKPMAEHEYLDAISEPGYNNYRRRVGHAALSTITYQLTHKFVAPALVEDAYKHLEFLNEVSQEERLSFLVTCAHIQKLLGHGDRKTAEEEYLALLRSFMPQSTAFKPPKGQTVYAMPAAA